MRIKYSADRNLALPAWLLQKTLITVPHPKEFTEP
jgi:hypothetical protein